MSEECIIRPTFSSGVILPDAIERSVPSIGIGLMLVRLKYLDFVSRTGAGIDVRLAGGAIEKMVEPHQIPQFISVFSGGYMAVSLVFLLLFLRALGKRAQLGLNQIEVFETRVSIGASLVSLAVGRVSIMAALSGRGDLAGIIYPVPLGPGITLFRTVTARQRRQLTALQAAQDIRKVALWLGHSNLTTTEVMEFWLRTG